MTILLQEKDEAKRRASHELRAAAKAHSDLERRLAAVNHALEKREEKLNATLESEEQQRRRADANTAENGALRAELGRAREAEATAVAAAKERVSDHEGAVERAAQERRQTGALAKARLGGVQLQLRQEKRERSKEQVGETSVSVWV